MKKTLIIASILINLTLNGADCVEQASAEEAVDTTTTTTTDVPKHLKGAKIIVRQADGRESEVPAELFKVVPRTQQRIVTKTKETKVISCVEKESDHNRISVLGGHGTKSGLKSSSDGSKAVVENRVGAVLGLQYQRELGNSGVSIGVQGQTNKTGSLVLGLDF